MAITLPGEAYALDSSAILCLLDNEPGADQVRKILNKAVTGSADVLVCALHWGEVAMHLYGKKGATIQERVMAQLAALAIEIIPVTPERSERAAILTEDLKIPYVGAFGIELAESEDCTFVTADYELKPAAHRVEIQFLPSKYFRFETLPDL